MKATVIHPATFKRFQAAAKRLSAFNEHLQRTMQFARAGGLTTLFTEDELHLLNEHGYLSDNDKSLIKQSNGCELKPSKWRKK